MTVVDITDTTELSAVPKAMIKLLERGARKYGPKFDPSDLVEAQHFAPFYFSKERIKVQVWEELEGTRTGTVGMTTGWKPAFLLMHRSSDHGSSDVLTQYDKIIAVRDKRERYIPVR